MSVQERYKQYVSDQREFFDTLITEDWETYKSEEWDEIRRFEIDQLFVRIQPKTILDVGCGCGFHDQEMATYPFVRSVDAIDYSSKSIEAANKHYPHENVRRWAADITTLSCDRQYDLVVSYQVFEHVDTPDAFIIRSSQLLRPGGYLAIFTPNRNRLSNVLRRLKGQEPELCDPQHFREYSPREIRSLAESNGLEFVSWFGYGLSGMKFLDRQAASRRLRLGVSFPWIANCFCLLLKKKS